MAKLTLNEDGTVSLQTTRLEMIGLAATLAGGGVELFEEMQPILQAISGDPNWQRSTGQGIDGPITKGEVEAYFADHGKPVPPL